MGTFTIPLKDVLKFTGGKMGLDNYPIFDEAYRETLNKKIERHYWNREIGHETIDIFLYQMESKMNEIMPLYNQHYKLGLLEADPLSTMSVKSLTQMDSTANVTGTSESGSVSGSKARGVVSDTPQTQLSEDDDYATQLQDNTSETTATGNQTDNQSTLSEGTNENTLTGYQGHAPELILRARQTLVNVDMLVIADLRELFMLIWHNDDEFTQNNFGGYRRYGF